MQIPAGNRDELPIRGVLNAMSALVAEWIAPGFAPRWGTSSPTRASHLGAFH